MNQNTKGNYTSYEYDKLGRLTRVITPVDNNGSDVIKYYRDALGT